MNGRAKRAASRAGPRHRSTASRVRLSTSNAARSMPWRLLGISRTLSRLSRNRTAGRLEGTHAFPRNHVPKARRRSLFLDQIDIAAEDPGQSLAESLQPTEVIESPGRKPCTRPDGQIHVGRAGGVATRKRAKQRNCFNALRPEFRLMRP
jgi:hypothetical protein